MAERAGLDLEALRREQVGVHAAFERYGGNRADYCVWTSMDQFDAILAALERAERLEKAAQEALRILDFLFEGSDHANESAWAKLRAALEGRDG